MSARQAVFDCNVFLQAMLSDRGASHECWQRVQSGEVKLFITPYMVAEIRRLPDHRSLRRFSRFTPERVERFLEELLDVAVFIPDPVAAFEYARDPADAHYVTTAISTGSLLIVSSDRDLLDLMSDLSVEGIALRATHPSFKVYTPPQFLRLLD